MNVHIRPRRLVRTCLIAALVLGGGCRTPHQAATESFSSKQVVCSFIPLWLTALPLPGLDLFASTAIMGGLAMGSAILGQSACSVDSDTSLGTQSLTDIAALVGTQADVALDDDARTRLQALIAEMQHYSPSPGVASGANGELANMITEATYLATKFQTRQDPLPYVINYVGAVGFELSLLQERLRLDLVSAKDAKLNHSDLYAPWQATIARDCHTILDVIKSSRDEYLPALRTDGVKTTVRGYFNDKLDDKSFVYRRPTREVEGQFKMYYYVKPLSNVETATIAALASRGRDIPITLKTRQDLQKNPLSLVRTVKAKDGNDYTSQLGKAQAELTDLLQKKVDDLARDIDQQLFQTDALKNFTTAVNTMEKSSQAILALATSGQLFTQTGAEASK